MNKEEILKISQQESKGKFDERELLAFGKASQVGMLVGAILCVLLVLVSDLVLNNPIIGMVGWLVYFSMQASCSIVLYIYLKKPIKLVYAIVEIIFAVIFAIMLIIKSVA